MGLREYNHEIIVLLKLENRATANNLLNSDLTKFKNCLLFHELGGDYLIDIAPFFEGGGGNSWKYIPLLIHDFVGSGKTSLLESVSDLKRPPDKEHKKSEIL